MNFINPNRVAAMINNQKYFKIATIATMALLAGFCLLWLSFSPIKQHDYGFAGLTPWVGIGGCGAGGSGGAGSAIRWIGEGVSGGRVTLQFLYSKAIGQNYLHDTYQARFSGKPTWSSELGLSLPIVHKLGPLQPATQMEEEAGHVTGGISDITIDYSLMFGQENEFSALLNLTMPTGQYDIMRGKDGEKQFLSTTLQRGSGTWSAQLGLSYSKDVEDGLWVLEATYALPFNLNLRGKNKRISNKTDEYNTLHKRWNSLEGDDRDRFEYYFKPYGENDLGGFTPQSISLTAFYGYRGIKGYVHSFGLTFSAPIGVGWIPNFTTTVYDPVPDPDHKTWTGSINYGLEFSRQDFPVFIAVSKPIQDKTNPPVPGDDPYDESIVGQWSWPDWNDFLQAWTFAVGVKAAMF